MNVKAEQLGNCLAKLTIDVSAEQVDKAFEKAERHIAKRAQLPGFRVGHVPRHLVAKQFNGDVVQQAAQEVVNETLWPAVEEAKLEPVAQPQLQLQPLSRGQPLVYTATFEIQPEVLANTLEGLSVAKISEELPDEAVNERLEALRNQAAETVPVVGRDIVQQNDFVLVDYDGSIDGAPLAGGKGQNALVEVGGEGYIPGFAEGLSGKTVPGQCEVVAKFPEDYNVEHLRGKEAIFKMELKELKERQMPELNDAFASDLGDASLAATRERLATELAADVKREAEGKRRRAALEALVAANPIEVPPSRIDEQVEYMLDGFERQMQQFGNEKFRLDESQRADMRSERRQEADFLVKSGLLLVAAAKKLGVSVGPSDIDTEIERLAEEAKERGPALRSAYAGDEQRRGLAFRLTEDKVVSHIMEHAHLA